MKKSKVIFLVLLISLFFNIVHDLVLAEEFNENCQVSLEQVSSIAKDDGCSKMHYLHEIFHFTAILPLFIESHHVYSAYLKVNFTAQPPFNSLHKNNFRPPIA